MTTSVSVSERQSVLGVVLAGGLSRRMGGGDKSVLPWNNHTLLEEIVSRTRPQVDQLVISANRPPEALPRLGLPVIADEADGESPSFHGPLAGIVSVMNWCAREGTGHQWLATFATDTPFVPRDFVTQCLATVNNRHLDVIYARSAKRNHYTMALWRIELLPWLRQQLQQGERALKSLLAARDVAVCEFSAKSFDPFFNINTPEDWQQAQRYLQHAEK